MNQALIINEQVGDKIGMARSLDDLAIIYRSKGNLTKALNCQNRTLEIGKEFEDIRYLSFQYWNLGHTYRIKGNYEKALSLYLHSLKIREQIGQLFAFL